MLNINELENLQNKKIEYFFRKIGIRDIHRAERYLNEANWDEKLAVANFIRRHNPNYQNNLNNLNKNNQEENQNNQDAQFQRPPPTEKSERNNSRIMKKVIEPEKNYISLKMTQIIEDHKFNNGPNSESISLLKTNLKPVELVFNNFLKAKKNLMHIIIIYSEESFNRRIINQLKPLKKHNLYSMLEQNAIIFPVVSQSPIGKELSKQFLCISFPSCLFCKFRDNEELCVINRMEGVFDVSFFYESILFEENKIVIELPKPNSSKNNVKVKNKNIPNSNNNRIIVNENKNPNNIINELRDSNYFNENYENRYRNYKGNQTRNNDLNQLNQRTGKNNTNRNKYNNRDISKDAIDKKKNENIKRNVTQNRKENDKINNQNLNQEIMDDYFLGNSQDLTSLIKKIYGEQNNNQDDNNNNNYNDNNNNNHNQNDNVNDRKYRNNNKYNNNSINNNIINNKYNNYKTERNKEKNNSNKNVSKNNNDRSGNDDPFKNVKKENLIKRDNMLADSIYGLTDAQVLAKRENEIKELERQQEEKEKKEEEEKRKILEEENRIKNLNNKYEYEAKAAKMILPKEPDENDPNACFIKFRLPDGEKIIERRFLKTDKIATLYDYVKSIGREIFMEQDSHDFDLFGGGFPPKNLGDKKNNTLEEEEMFPNFILQIREI